jgi:hypothetical protein
MIFPPEERPDSVREEVRQTLIHHRLLGKDRYLVPESTELGYKFESEIAYSAAVRTLVELVSRLAEEIDSLKAER